MIEQIIKDTLKIVQNDQEKTAFQEISCTPLSTEFRKIAYALRNTKQKFTVEDVKPIVSMLKTADFTDKVSLMGRSRTAFNQGYSDGVKILNETLD